MIAAVSGYALGGGCELAMMCDIILAADTAKFGQPEINLGVIPGMGGSQRLIRAVGYYKAAELILTGRMMDAAEAERSGLVSRVVPAADLLDEAAKTAEAIASKTLPSLYAAKAVLDAALEASLAEGLRLERHVFASLFDTADQKEGMSAFREKRAPDFTVAEARSPSRLEPFASANRGTHRALSPFGSVDSPAGSLERGSGWGRGSVKSPASLRNAR